jgi:hypothetical protein
MRKTPVRQSKHTYLKEYWQGNTFNGFANPVISPSEPA